MPEFGPYAAEVTAAYGVTLALLAGLVAASVIRSRKVSRELEAAERRARDG